MPAQVYVETTIVSYLTARPSRDIVRAAHQRVTREWWEQRRADFQVFVSQAVLEEAAGGDSVAAAERLEALRNIPLLEISETTAGLAERLIEDVPLPERAAVDALHIALAVTHGMQYLLTWNCRHIANAALRTRIEEVCRQAGFEPPVICTPEELMEEA